MGSFLSITRVVRFILVVTLEQVRILSSSLSFGMHFGTFQLTDEAYDRPVKDLSSAREKLKISAEKFRVLDQGESYSF